MKRIQLIIILFFSSAVLLSCSDDMDDEDTTATAALYKVTVINGTGADIEVFFLGNEENAEYERKGILEAGNEIVISNLVVRQTYVVAAADPGGSLEDFFYQQTLNRTSPTDVTLTVNR